MKKVFSRAIQPLRQSHDGSTGNSEKADGELTTRRLSNGQWTSTTSAASSSSQEDVARTRSAKSVVLLKSSGGTENVVKTFSAPPKAPPGLPNLGLSPNRSLNPDGLYGDGASSSSTNSSDSTLITPQISSRHRRSSDSSDSTASFVEADEPKFNLLEEADAVEDLGQRRSPGTRGVVEAHEIVLNDEDESLHDAQQNGTANDSDSTLRAPEKDGATAASASTSKLAVQLTPEERHYLNKALCHLQMADEWAALSEVGELTQYPEPYLPHANGPRSKPNSKAKNPMSIDQSRLTEAPMMGYLSWRLLFTFPGLRYAPDEEWHRIQAFFDSMAEHNLSQSSERGEATKRRVMAMAFNRLFSTFGAMGIRAAGNSRPAHLDEQLVKAIDDLYKDSSKQQYELWKQAGRDAESHRQNWKQWVKDLYQTNELDDTFDLVAEVATAEELPPRYKKLINWACLWIAQLIYAIFVASDKAKDSLSLFARIHKMIPYGLFRQSLRIASPAFLAKTMVNVIFSEPFRQKSLFTRVCTSILSGDLKDKQAKLAELSKELGDQKMYDALNEHVYAQLAEQEATRALSLHKREDIIITILRRAQLSDRSVRGVAEACTAYEAALRKHDKPSIEKPGTPAYRFAQLKVLLRTLSEKRDREEITEVMLESNTPEMIKTTVQAFYGTVASIASATKLSIHVTDLENFMGDVVKTCSQPNCSRADTIRLVQRNAPSFYRFIHDVHSQDDDLMSGLIDWCRSAFDMMRDGVPKSDKTDARFGLDDAILANLAAEQQKAAVAEVRRLRTWTRMHKAKEDIRRRIDFASLADANFDGEALSLLSKLVRESEEFSSLEKELLSSGVLQPSDALEWVWYSSKPQAFSLIAATPTALSDKSRPPVNVDSIRLLQPAYRQAISKPLANARKSDIREYEGVAARDMKALYSIKDSSRTASASMTSSKRV